MTKENNYYTDERICSDLDYQRAQRTARCMLDTGLISDTNSTNYATSTAKHSHPCLRKYIRKLLAMCPK